MRWNPAWRLYAIVDTEVCLARGLAPRAVAAAFLSGGARLLQLRAKREPSGAFLQTVESIASDARAHGALVVVNDRADIARMAGAGGVHVGQDDLPAELVRRIVPDALVGLSTHDAGQIEGGLASAADYIAVGPVFETGTKETGYRARGLDLVGQAAGRGKPVVAIGGVTLATAPAVIAAGAAAVAVISDLLAGDIERRVRSYLQALA